MYQKYPSYAEGSDLPQLTRVPGAERKKMLQEERNLLPRIHKTKTQLIEENNAKWGAMRQTKQGQRSSKNVGLRKQDSKSTLVKPVTSEDALGKEYDPNKRPIKSSLKKGRIMTGASDITQGVASIESVQLTKPGATAYESNNTKMEIPIPASQESFVPAQRRPLRVKDEVTAKINHVMPDIVNNTLVPAPRIYLTKTEKTIPTNPHSQRYVSHAQLKRPVVEEGGEY